METTTSKKASGISHAGKRKLVFYPDLPDEYTEDYPGGLSLYRSRARAKEFLERVGLPDGMEEELLSYLDKKEVVLSPVADKYLM